MTVLDKTRPDQLSARQRRALLLWLQLTVSQQSASARQMARRLGVSYTSVSNYLGELVAKGIAEHVPIDATRNMIRLKGLRLVPHFTPDEDGERLRQALLGGPEKRGDGDERTEAGQ